MVVVHRREKRQRLRCSQKYCLLPVQVSRSGFLPFPMAARDPVESSCFSADICIETRCLSSREFHKNERVEILSRQFLSDPFKNYDKINDFQNEICNYLKHISNNYFLKKADKKHIFNHLKIITKYILMILLLFKTKKNKKNKTIKSNLIYFLSKLESRKYVNQNIINKIYKAIK